MHVLDGRRGETILGVVRREGVRRVVALHEQGEATLRVGGDGRPQRTPARAFVEPQPRPRDGLIVRGDDAALDAVGREQRRQHDLEAEQVAVAGDVERRAPREALAVRVRPHAARSRRDAVEHERAVRGALCAGGGAEGIGSVAAHVTFVVGELSGDEADRGQRHAVAVFVDGAAADADPGAEHDVPEVDGRAEPQRGRALDRRAARARGLEHERELGERHALREIGERHVVAVHRHRDAQLRASVGGAGRGLARYPLRQPCHCVRGEAHAAPRRAVFVDEPGVDAGFDAIRSGSGLRRRLGRRRGRTRGRDAVPRRGRARCCRGRFEHGRVRGGNGLRREWSGAARRHRGTSNETPPRDASNDDDRRRQSHLSCIHGQHSGQDVRTRRCDPRARRRETLARERREEEGPARARAEARVQLRAQLGETAREAPAHRARRHAQHARDLRARLPFEVAQDERRPQRFVDRAHGLEDGVLQLEALERVRRRRLGLRRERPRLVVRAPPLAATPAPREVAHDARQPWRELALARRRVEKRRDGRVLHDVVRGASIAQQALRERAHPARVGEQALGIDGKRVFHGSHPQARSARGCWRILAAREESRERDPVFDLR